MTEWDPVAGLEFLAEKDKVAPDDVVIFKTLNGGFYRRKWSEIFDLPDMAVSAYLLERAKNA